MPEEPLYTFPSPPAPDLAEWAGSPMGISNTITRTKGRTAIHNKTVDRTPGLLEKLLTSAHDHIDRSAGQTLRTHDVIIHGLRVRATTNSLHLHDFWVDNWFSLEEWKGLTGQTPPGEPHVTVYALTGVPAEQEAAYYSRAKNTIVFFNTSYYGQLKSWVLGAVGRILAADYGIHSIHGACVEQGGKGVLYIAPTGTGKSTSSYGLMAYPKTRFHSDDWVYVRYTYATHEGRRVFILGARGSDGSEARGYRVYRWIETHQHDASAELSAMTLDDQPLRLALADLDLAQPLEAYAYTSEKVFYLRTNLAENFPMSAFQILSAKEENVPDITSAFLQKNRSTLQRVLRDLQAARDGHFGKRPDVLAGKSDSEVERICGRLIAFDNARSMLDIGNVLPPGRIYANPLEPARLAVVMLLKRNPDDPTILDHLSLDSFMDRLLVGETPDRKRETAYNAYRAVDDQAERALIEGLEKQVGPSRTLYSQFAQTSDVPVSLEEEFELFRVMYQATRAYELNTTLQKDPTVQEKWEAVRRTIAIIARTLLEEPRGIHLTLGDYERYLS